VLRIIPLVLLAALCLGDAAFPQEILFNASLFYLTDYGSNSVFCTDLNGDGHRDLVTCNYSADNVSVLLNDGQGPFLEAVDYQVGDQPFSVFCGDLDGEGDLDLVTSNYYTDDITLLFNLTNTYYMSGDANGDGSVDVGDVVNLTSFLYKGGSPPDPLWTGDCNCDQVVNLGDVVYLINYLFEAGPPPGCGTASR
jgi:hypothetical protein